MKNADSYLATDSMYSYKQEPRDEIGHEDSRNNRKQTS